MKKFLSILLLCLPLGGTAIAQKLDKPEVPVYEGLSPRNIQWELAPSFLFSEDENLSGLTFFDRRYVSVTKETMERWTAAAFKKVDKTYVAELHDCDKLAAELLVFLRREAMKAHPQMEYAILAGMAAVTITQPVPELGINLTGDHALVLIRVRGGTWWLVEPSNGKGTKLEEELWDGRLQLNGAWF